MLRLPTRQGGCGCEMGGVGGVGQPVEHGGREVRERAGPACASVGTTRGAVSRTPAPTDHGEPLGSEGTVHRRQSCRFSGSGQESDPALSVPSTTVGWVMTRDLLRSLDAPLVDAASCGLAELDRVAGGLAPGRVWLLTGTPGQGRTTLLTQLALRLAVTLGWDTQLVCPQEPARHVAARLLAHRARLSLSDVVNGQVPADALDRQQRTRDALGDAPLCVCAQGGSHGLDVVGEIEQAPPRALLVDDAQTIAGVSPERLRTLAAAGTFVAATLPRDQVVAHDPSGYHLRPAWAGVADVIVEVRQTAGPFDPTSIRPGEADLVLLRNRWGPLTTAAVAFQGHYARFVDLVPGSTG